MHCRSCHYYDLHDPHKHIVQYVRLCTDGKNPRTIGLQAISMHGFRYITKTSQWAMQYVVHTMYVAEIVNVHPTSSHMPMNGHKQFPIASCHAVDRQ
jgi:hypothetical protein